MNTLDPIHAKKLRKLLLETERHVPVYREWWRKAGCDIERLSSTGDFDLLPIVGKADFLETLTERRLDDRYDRKKLLTERTSGSTSEPFTMYFDRKAWLKRRMRFIRALLDCGYRPGHSLMLISSRHFVSVMRLARWHYVGLDRGESELWTKYQQIRPAVLYGPLSSLLILAQKALDSGREFHRPRVVISTAEQLTNTSRTYLGQVFGADVADFYGSTELGLVAWRRPGCTHYVQKSEDLLFEFLPAENDTALERLVVTDLTSGPMPLVRFDTGDLVHRSQRQPNAPIEEFVGRKVDCLVMPDGTRISPYQVTTSLEEIRELQRYEVVQHTNYSVEVTFWSNATDNSAVATRVIEAVDRVCDGKIQASAFHTSEQLTLTGRKIRPVRSEVKGRT